MANLPEVFDQALPAERVLLADDVGDEYGHDETLSATPHCPAAVLLPETTEEVAATLARANELTRRPAHTQTVLAPFTDLQEITSAIPTILAEGLQADPEVREKVMRALLQAGVELGGAISGEHGIGRHKKPYFLDPTDPVAVRLRQGIRATFDPNGILEPGAICDSQEATR